MRRFALVTCIILTGAALACAKPNTEQGTSGGLGDPADSGGEDQAQDIQAQDTQTRPAGEPVAVEAPTPGSCRPSRIREVRYGSTVDKRVKLPAGVGSRRCAEDLDAQLEDDIACARGFNEASWGHALYEAGLALVEHQETGGWGGGYGGNPPQPRDLGSVEPHPEDPNLNLVFLGYDNYDCSGHHSYTRVSPGVRLARNRAGELVVVLFNPTVSTDDARSYVRCSCFSGCGAMRETMARYAAVPADETLGPAVTLEYPAISISSGPVENQSCCCAP